MRLIDADRLKAEINELMILYRKKTIDSVSVEEAVPFIEAMHIAKNVEFVVDGQPTVEMRPKGQWIGYEERWVDGEEMDCWCSVCNHDVVLCGTEPPKFCGECGAEMAGYSWNGDCEDEID